MASPSLGRRHCRAKPIRVAFWWPTLPHGINPKNEPESASKLSAKLAMSEGYKARVPTTVNLPAHACEIMRHD